MALHIIRAERTDVLADGLGNLLATPPPDPFAEDLVVVPARGVERWLSQRLSHVLGRGTGADGVCAGVSFRSPASLITEIAGTRDEDPWSPDVMTWPLLEVIDAHLDQPWCATLANHLGHFAVGEERTLRQGRRYGVARRLAGLFASYARQRPQLLAGWLDGEVDGLAEDLAWQPPLWRALADLMAIDPPHARHAKTIAQLRESGSEQLPPRLSLFGHTRLAATDIELLEALAVHHEIHLWLPHPSAGLWTALEDLRGPVSRRSDTSHRRVGHPLLATLGRDLRELQRCLPGAVASDRFLPGVDHPDTLLGWLQSDIAANAVRAQNRSPQNRSPQDRSPQSRSLRDDDRSVQVHSCHGPARQVDVLREVLLGLLADDETLEPRDILVMCPDIETYAPLIVADFGLGEVVRDGHPAHRLRVRLADRSLVQTNPLLAVASQLLSLTGSRVTATEVLDLANATPVRARFGFTDDDLQDITDWVREANIRWGLDPEHRAPYGVDFVHNTWRFGLDRILTGVVLSDDSQGAIETTLPLDDVGSNSVELAGRLAEFCARLQVVTDSLSGTRPLREWLAALADGIRLLTRVEDADAWQLSQLEREFNDVTATAGARDQTPLQLSDVAQLLRRHLAGRPTRANFRTGTLTVCTMVPMRSVPHRVVCLVGLDDTVFPRSGVLDGDDVLAREPMTGERDVRSEDRQLLLDAVCAATETLVITYTGADEYSGQQRPPAVPLAELLDAFDVTTGEPVRERITVRHPLQPFDARNVQPGALTRRRPDTSFSFDPTVQRAATVAAGHREDPPGFVAHPLPSPDTADVSLAELTAFFRDPVKGFFRALDYTLPAEVDGIDDAIPVEIDALQEWTVGDRMLRDVLAGISPDRALKAEWCRGTLPPGQLGWRKAKEILDRVVQLAAEAMPLRSEPARAIDVDIELGAGRRLAGTVSPVYGARLVSVTYSRLDGKHLLAAWVPLLALAAHMPATDWSAVCIGRGKGRGGPRRTQLAGPQTPAAELLRDLVAIYDAGRREPLPLPLKTSFAWAEARHSGFDPVYAAGQRWRSANFPGEDAQPAHVRAWGPGATLDDLMQPPRPGEEHPGENNRLGAYAARLWFPLLRAVQGG
ncbi:MAG: exodeoxyribonuclease V subunit gamma [Mycobacterium sp.]|nr:exodeoxyribonuclease V subunit gamma [Mycobacterium sp.]